MSAITDWAAQIQAALAQVQTGITALDAQIQALQNSPGTLSPEDQAALDGISAASAALAASANAMPAPPAPVPAPAQAKKP